MTSSARFLLVFLLILISSILTSTFGQEYFNAPDTNSNHIETDFFKKLTTWEWAGRIHLASLNSKYWQWQIKEYFHSNLLIPALGKKQWKDENTFRGTFLRKNTIVDYGIYSRSWYQSDKQGSSDNQFGNQILGLLSSYNFRDIFRFTPYLGYQQSKNRKIVDWGWDVGVKGELSNYTLGDYHTSALVESNYDFYERRQNYDHSINISTRTQFNQYTRDSLTFAYSELSKQYYGSGLDQNNLVKVKIYNREIQNRLYYALSKNNLFSLWTKIQSRSLNFVNDRSIFLLENQLRFLHIGSLMSYGLNLLTSDESQDNMNLNTDSRTRKTTMNFQLGYRFSSAKKLDLNFTYDKLQHDTPDENNNDDRDEQRFIFNLDYFHRFSPFLLMEWNAYVYLFHQIYIQPEQSQNNNWNRVFKLNPVVLYEYGRIKNSLSTEVLANYSDYDFEKIFLQTRSYVFRKYTFADSLTYRFLAENHIGFYTRIELEDKGSFFEKQFAQQIIQSYRSSFYNVFWENRDLFDFEIRLGYTTYARREWRHIPTKIGSRDITNQGPYINLRYKTSRKLIFSAYFSYSNWRDSNANSSNYMTGFLRFYLYL